MTVPYKLNKKQTQDLVDAEIKRWKAKQTWPAASVPDLWNQYKGGVQALEELKVKLFTGLPQPANPHRNPGTAGNPGTTRNPGATDNAGNPADYNGGKEQGYNLSSGMDSFNLHGTITGSTRDE